MPSALKPLKLYKKLSAKKGRLEAGTFIVEGDRAIRQIIASQPGDITEILTVENPPPAYRDYNIRLLTESQFSYISGTRTPQGIMAVVNLPSGIYSDRLPEDIGNKVLLLEDIQDPGNVGTLIRTAAAFDFSGVIMTEKSADPVSPKCVRSAAGTLLSVWLRRTDNYIGMAETMKEAGFTLVAADLNGAAEPAVLSCQPKLVLALGNEAAGISKKLLEIVDYRLRIPTVRDKAESLNVAACGAICMYLSSNG